MTTTMADLFTRLGIKVPDNAYTPISLTSGGRPTVGSARTKTLSAGLRNINYTSADELRAYDPETVTKVPVYTMDGNPVDATSTYSLSKGFFAIRGDMTNKTYSVCSAQYEPIQHADILNVLTDYTEAYGMETIGSYRTDGARMNVYGFYTDPSMNIDLSLNNHDPAVLGVRVFNSHGRDNSFGAEIFAVRAICSNYMAFAKSLGYFRIPHMGKKHLETAVDRLKSLIDHGIDSMPTLHDRLENARNTIIRPIDIEPLLIGTGLGISFAGNITDNFDALNPLAEKEPTLYDVYNAATAHISHRSNGYGMVQSTNLYSGQIESLLHGNTDNFIDKGIARMTAMAEASA